MSGSAGSARSSAARPPRCATRSRPSWRRPASTGSISPTWWRTKPSPTSSELVVPELQRRGRYQTAYRRRPAAAKAVRARRVETPHPAAATAKAEEFARRVPALRARLPDGVRHLDRPRQQRGRAQERCRRSAAARDHLGAERGDAQLWRRAPWRGSVPACDRGLSSRAAASVTPLVSVDDGDGASTASMACAAIR